MHSRPSWRLAPTAPVPGPSRFLELVNGQSRRTEIGLRFVNEQKYFYHGAARGFAFFTERPHFEQHRPRPQRPPQIWRFAGWLIVAPEVRDVLCRFDRPNRI
jgi:hypothetical protein